MTKVIIRNINTGLMLASDAMLADNFILRLKGLLGKSLLLKGEGLIITPCNMVHTIRMKMCIDVVFVSSANRVVHIINSMKPNRISPLIKEASYVIELPAGHAKKTNTEIGNSIEVIFSIS